MSVVIVCGMGMVFAAALLGGLTGFGYNLLATPLLLSLGVSPASTVLINLAIAFLTRISVVVRLRSHIRWRRALPLMLGSVPGLLLGVVLGAVVDPTVLRVSTGVLVLVVAPMLLLRRATEGIKPPSRYAMAGLAGGVLGTSTSLNGVPAALLLSADQEQQRSFIADLAAFFVLSNLVGLALLVARDGVDPGALALLAWWLPGALVANMVGVSLGPRINPRVFRGFTCVLVMVAGVATVLSA